MAVAANETKTKQAIVADLPATLTPYIDYWLQVARPVLLGDGRSDFMWLTTIGTRMAIDTAYSRFCRATKKELGVRINPHLVRDIIATGPPFSQRVADWFGVLAARALWGWACVGVAAMAGWGMLGAVPCFVAGLTGRAVSGRVVSKTRRQHVASKTRLQHVASEPVACDGEGFLQRACRGKRELHAPHAGRSSTAPAEASMLERRSFAASRCRPQKT